MSASRRNYHPKQCHNRNNNLRMRTAASIVSPSDCNYESRFKRQMPKILCCLIRRTKRVGCWLVYPQDSNCCMLFLPSASTTYGGALSEPIPSKIAVIKNNKIIICAMLQFNSVQFLVIAKKTKGFYLHFKPSSSRPMRENVLLRLLSTRQLWQKKRTVLEKQNPYKEQVQKGSSAWKRKTTPIDWVLPSYRRMRNIEGHLCPGIHSLWSNLFMNRSCDSAWL